MTFDQQGRLVMCQHGERRVARLEKEYTEAVRGGRVGLIVVDDRDIRRQLPGFGRFLTEECRRVPGAPATRDRLAVYACPAGGESGPTPRSVPDGRRGAP